MCALCLADLVVLSSCQSPAGAASMAAAEAGETAADESPSAGTQSAPPPAAEPAVVAEPRYPIRRTTFFPDDRVDVVVELRYIEGPGDARRS